MRIWPIIALMVIGCDPLPCSRTRVMLDADSPVITHFAPLSSDESNPLADDPWAVIYALDFINPGNNLADGNLKVYFAGNTTPTLLPLQPLLLTSNLPVDAPLGRMALRWEFANSIGDGQSFRMSVQLQGDDGRLSNCYCTDYYFAVDSAD